MIEYNSLPFIEIEPPDHLTGDFKYLWDIKKRILFFDPKDVYERALPFIDPNKRIQTKLNTAILFPKRTDKLCRCGCGLEGKKMWASLECSQFAYSVYQIIAYGTSGAKNTLKYYYGDKCQICKENYWEDIDHIIPVKHGGGGCWINNFLPVCKKCHKEKTKKDFNWKEYKLTPQAK